MRKSIKDIRSLSREIAQNSVGNYPVLVLDTGGLIDIIESIRQYNFICRNGDRDPKYELTTSFLKHLGETLPIVITPRTYQEIQDHGNVKLGDYIFEIPKKVVDFTLGTMENSVKFVSRLKSRLELDAVKYDAYWTSKLCCNGNIKKYLEGCSDTDKEILSTAAYVSQCRTERDERKKMGQVLVVSPDAHIIQGVEFLKRGFDGKYSSMVPISTRH